MSNLLSLQSGCPCCFPTVIVIVLLVPCLLLYVIKILLTLFFPKFKFGINAINIMTRIINFLILLVAVGLGLAASNPQWKSYIFYQFLTTMQGGADPFASFRCPHFDGIAGRVLEIGPGAGANFACFGPNSNTTNSITEWVGVEPNEFFQNKIAEAVVKNNITFPTRTVWLKGENVDVEPDSFDVVYGTHVLCSVDDVYQVLNQVGRALKPGGTYYFMEHVAAEPDSSIHYVQFFMEPFFNIIGNGCRFRELWVQLNSDIASGGGLKGFDVNVTRFDAPIGMLPLVPHIIGTAKKLE